MSRNKVRLALCFVLTCGAISLFASPAAAGTFQCQYNFLYTSGVLDYCVTVNGNIPQFYTPSGVQLLAAGYGEGYGICNESPAQNYTDYGSSGDTGNWGNSTLVSKTATSVKIARTTKDGNWTLTQTITQASTKTASITVVMALTNNQSVSKVAYLVRYADAHPNYSTGMQLATVNSALSWTNVGSGGAYDWGLLLQNVGTPQFGYWQGFAQDVESGPNACAFAFNAPYDTNHGSIGSIEIAYVGSVSAHGTKSVSLTYRGL
jgi:hypothetical protein